MTPADSARVNRWLLDSDPAIRWQALRDLIGAPADEVAAERARVATEGWGARLLALQGGDGRWGDAAWNHGWNSTMHVLLLRDMGRIPTPRHAAATAGSARARSSSGGTTGSGSPCAPVVWARTHPSSCISHARLLEAQALAQRVGVALLRVTSLLGCTRQAWYGLHRRPPLEKPSEHWARLVEKARLITEADAAGPPGDPQEAWQCAYCAHAGPCAYRIRKHTPEAADDK